MKKTAEKLIGLRMLLLILTALLLVLPCGISAQFGDFPSEVSLEEGKSVIGNRYFPIYRGMHWKWNASPSGAAAGNAVVEETIISSDASTSEFESEKNGYIEGELLAREQKKYQVMNGSVFILEHVLTPDGDEPLKITYDPPCLLMPANPWVRRNWMCKTSRITSTGEVTDIEEFNVEGFMPMTVPAGSFDDCARIRHLMTSIRNGKQSEVEGVEWYCPGAGLVRLDEGGMKKLELEVRKDVKTASAGDRTAAAVAAPAAPQVVETSAPWKPSKSLKVAGGIMTLPGYSNENVLQVGIVGWSADEKYLAYTERVAAGPGGMERAGMYIVEVPGGKIVLRYERFICRSDRSSCSPGDIRLSGVDNELNGLLMERNAARLRDFSIGSDPGYIFIEPERKSDVGGVESVENVAMVLSPSRKVVYTMVMTEEGVLVEESGVASAEKKMSGKPVGKSAGIKGITKHAPGQPSDRAEGEADKLSELPVREGPARQGISEMTLAKLEGGGSDGLLGGEPGGSGGKAGVGLVPEKYKETAGGKGGATDTESGPKDCPAGMVYAAPGSFVTGCTAAEVSCADKRPGRRVAVEKGFCIDKFEVGIEKYGPRGRRPAPGAVCETDCPVDSVSWDEASRYCAGREGRLPTEEEWEFAGKSGLLSVRGYAKNPTRETGTRPVWRSDDQVLGRDEDGLFLSMQGERVTGIEAWEWTGDCYDNGRGPGDGKKGVNAGNCSIMTVRGGKIEPGAGFYESVAARDGRKRSAGAENTGFRCVWDKFPEEKEIVPEKLPLVASAGPGARVPAKQVGKSPGVDIFKKEPAEMKSGSLKPVTESPRKVMGKAPPDIEGAKSAGPEPAAVSAKQEDKEKAIKDTQTEMGLVKGPPVPAAGKAEDKKQSGAISSGGSAVLATQKIEGSGGATTADRSASAAGVKPAAPDKKSVVPEVETQAGNEKDEKELSGDEAVKVVHPVAPGSGEPVFPELPEEKAEGSLTVGLNEKAVVGESASSMEIKQLAAGMENGMSKLTRQPASGRFDNKKKIWINTIVFETESEKDGENALPGMKTTVSLDAGGEVRFNLGVDDGLRQGALIKVYNGNKWVADVKVDSAGSLVSKGRILASAKDANLAGKYVIGDGVAIPVQ